MVLNGILNEWHSLWVKSECCLGNKNETWRVRIRICLPLSQTLRAEPQIIWCLWYLIILLCVFSVVRLQLLILGQKGMYTLGDNFPWVSCFCISWEWGTNCPLFRTIFWKKGQSCLLSSKIMSPFEQSAGMCTVYYKRFGFPQLRLPLL